MGDAVVEEGGQGLADRFALACGMNNPQRHNGSFLLPKSFMSFASATFLMIVLSSCSGDKVINKAELQTKAEAALTSSVNNGEQSPPITCPGSLKAKVGETTTCTMEIVGKTYDVSVVIKSLEGDIANFDVEVATEPNA
jgi:Domain of unknown function (DUF4333)